MRRYSSAAFHLAAAHSTFQLSSFRGMWHRLPGRRGDDERREIGLGPSNPDAILVEGWCRRVNISSRDNIKSSIAKE